MQPFAELLQQCPPEVRANIRYIATDATGHRAAYFDRPIPKDGYWEATGPYYLIPEDSVSAVRWRQSLLKRPKRWFA